MFKLLKIAFFVGIFKKAKLNILLIVLSLFLMIVLDAISDDILKLSSESSPIILFLKWSINIILMFVIFFNIRKIIKIDYIITNKKKYKNKITRDKILGKTVLTSQRDIITKKYSK